MDMEMQAIKLLERVANALETIAKVDGSQKLGFQSAGGESIRVYTGTQSEAHFWKTRNEDGTFTPIE